MKIASKAHAIRSAYLFGSYATGTQKDYSDIDIAVVLAQAACTTEYLEESFRIFHAAQEYDSLLEIICFKQDEFENDGGAIVSLVKKEGIKIDLP